MKPNSFILFLFFLTIPLSPLLFGQPLPFGVKNSTELVKKAEDMMDMGDLRGALQMLEAAVRKRKDFGAAYRLVGALHKELGQYQEAIRAYDECFKVNSRLSRAAYYECADALMKTNQYEQALGMFEHFRNMKDDYDMRGAEDGTEAHYQSYVDKNIEHCQFALTYDFEIISEKAENLGKAINTRMDEYMPYMNPEGNVLIYTSAMPPTVFKMMKFEAYMAAKQDSLSFDDSLSMENLYSAGAIAFAANEKPSDEDENIFISRRKEDGTWTSGTMIDDNINTPFNEGMATLSADGKRLYFAACQRPESNGGCDIFVSTVTESAELVNTKPVGGRLNGVYWDSQPSISCDGTQLFFVSNRPGGYGGTDIWMSRRLTADTWAAAQNLGPDINTPYDEESPYIARDGQTLFFSSNGLPGFGEQDIFKCEWKFNGWAKPTNLGNAINTPFRETGFFIANDNNEAYFASNRNGGLGNLDLYKIGLAWLQMPQRSVLIEGTVLDKITSAPIANARVSISNKEVAYKKELFTDPNGKFFICLTDKRPYSFVVDKKEYESFIGGEYLERKKGEGVREMLFSLVPPIQAQAPPPAGELGKPTKSQYKVGKTTIYFEPNSFNLSESEKVKIDNMIAQFQSVPGFTAAATGFADVTGDPASNLVLSKNRAKAVADYLISRNIPAAKVTYDGKGELRSEVEGANHRKRRVELILTSHD